MRDKLEIFYSELEQEKENNMGNVTVKTGNKSSSSSGKMKVGNVTYELPKNLSKPIENLGGYVMLIYGRKKIGKTSLASMFSISEKKVLFLFFEPGGKSLSLYQEPMTSWKKFTRFVQLISKDKFYGTVVIDTADYAYDDCLTEVCSDNGVTHPADLPYGKGWNLVKSEFTKQIRILLKSGKGVIFISHQKEVEVEDRDGKTYDKVTNTLSGQAREVIEGLVDIWANYDYEGNERILTILGSKNIDAGHRVDTRFRYTNGERIRKISMGKSKEEAYRNFIDAFNNKLVKSEGEKNAVIKKKPINKFRR